MAMASYSDDYPFLLKLLKSENKMNGEQSQENLNINVVGLKTVEHQKMIDCYFDLNFNNICRVCLEKNQENKKLCNIFENSKHHYSFMIMACASVQIMENDGLPSMICSKCIRSLNVAWQFKQQCERSDAKLRQYLGNSQHLQVTPDLESFSIGVKEEQNLFTLTDNSQLFPLVPQQNTEVATQSSAILEPINHLIMEESQQTTIEPSKPPETVKKPISNKQKKKETKQHQCDTCGKIFNRREYLTQHIRIHTGEKPYRCHLCEKRFINSGHLSTHMRTHTGEKPHRCTLCPKAFSTKQELHKHSMVHSGERPFVCKLCSKRFGSSSNLYSHYKHHTGEKNFTCERCGKAFYTKQELKQHSVVHTGEKPFLCELCDKRFSQIAHLRRHFKSHKSS